MHGHGTIGNRRRPPGPAPPPGAVRPGDSGTAPPNFTAPERRTNATSATSPTFPFAAAQTSAVPVIDCSRRPRSGVRGSHAQRDPLRRAEAAEATHGSLAGAVFHSGQAGSTRPRTTPNSAPTPAQPSPWARSGPAPTRHKRLVQRDPETRDPPRRRLPARQGNCRPRLLRFSPGATHRHRHSQCRYSHPLPTRLASPLGPRQRVPPRVQEPGQGPTRKETTQA